MFLSVVLLFLLVSGFFFSRRQTYWALVSPVALLFIYYFYRFGPTFWSIVWGGIFVAVSLLFGITALRVRFLTKRFFASIQKLAPKISETEKVGIDCGTVWFDGSLYSGRPQWMDFYADKIKDLSEEEQRFLDQEVEEICAIINDDDVKRTRELPEEFWNLCRTSKIFGMYIPKEHGGLGFSKRAQSSVVMKLATKSIAAAVTVMVPNSLGPGELIHLYGTDYQKKTYLKRLAEGEEIPCFGLTEPHAGSDATTLRSHGVVCYQEVDGENVLGIKLNFEKRYITLAPLATLIALAIHLYDPDGLLGKEEDLGITCVLLPRSMEGVWIGNHHNPMNVPFANGPIKGEDVFVPLSSVIGDRQGVGMGWRMLTECLAAGRSISLPALAGGALQVSTAATGSYTSLRKQFSVSLAQMDGIKEQLAHIAGLSYAVGAMQMVTCSALDSGENPSVLSGIVKAYSTEFMRTGVNSAMDIFAGHAICQGPHNVISRMYEAVPIAITVEGANILTRSMIIFGQGILRCHPYLYTMMTSMLEGDIKRFDRSFFHYVSYFVSNVVQWKFYRLGGWRFVRCPSHQRYHGGLSYVSTFFALMSDICLMVYGGSIKRKERVIGRLADVMAWLYVGSCVLKRYDHDKNKDLEPLVEYVMQMVFEECDKALSALIQNVPLVKWVRKTLLIMKGDLSSFTYRSKDKNEDRMIDIILHKEEVCNLLSQDVFVDKQDEEGKNIGLGALLKLGERYRELLPVMDKLKRELKIRHIKMKGDYLKKALDLDLLSQEEYDNLKDLEKDINRIIQVTHYTKEEYHNHAI